MNTSTQKYNVAIIGSGIAGSILGTILARNGFKVLIFEASQHPRFAIGESMILETSETMRAMAEYYDVPELAYFSSENFFSHVGTSHGVKRHFSYAHHLPHQRHNPAHTLQAVIPKQPHGHELHLYRQDTDYYLMVVALSYGATVLQNTPVKDINFIQDGVELVTTEAQKFEADYVVDASGFRSLLAQKFDLRVHNQRTHSRSIFTHMVNVPCYHEVGASQKACEVPFKVSEGTLHHVFQGGWLWVIPFNNHPQATNPLCSVGLMLDPRVHPLQNELSPEEEFFAFIEQYPDIKAQFAGATAVRNWTRTPRIQYSSKKVVGERFALLGHAVGFIDPLYSKGLYASLTSVSMLAKLLLEAKETGDYSAQKFQMLEDITLAFINTNDRLIANSYKSFSNYRLWNMYSVMWLLGAYTELVKLTSARLQSEDAAEYYSHIEQLKLVGGGFSEFDLIADSVDTIIEAVDPANSAAAERAVAEIQAIFANVKWMPIPFREVLAGKTTLPENKLKLRLLKPGSGFLGEGAYREHFFGKHSMADLLRVMVTEKVKYSVPVLKRKKRLRHSSR